MAGNSFGTLFKLTSFGESHGPAMGGVIDGCPAGLKIDLDKIQFELDRRRPGQSAVTTDRREEDKFEILSGIFEGKTTGSPIGFTIKNKDSRSQDYSEIKDVYRPSHADFTWQEKFGIRDYRGGGRASARETVSRVFAGAIAQQILNENNIEVISFVSAIGNIEATIDSDGVSKSLVDESIVRCPDIISSDQMVNLLSELKEKGDSTGGVISCVVRGLPVGLGEPVFSKLHAELAKGIFSINAVKGLEFGSGFSGSQQLGSDHNDAFFIDNEQIRTRTNNSGGIQGGISNGEEVSMRIAFKPIATIKTPQETLNTQGEQTVISPNGRHDPCVVPRAVPIVDAMVALVLVDMLLLSRSNRLK